MRRRKCPAHCWCLCHDTGGGVHDHPGRPCPGKTLCVGAVLYGYCGGYFGRDSYEDKRVEAIGADWVVCRDDRGQVHTYAGNLDNLTEYLTPREDDE